MSDASHAHARPPARRGPGRACALVVACLLVAGVASAQPVEPQPQPERRMNRDIRFVVIHLPGPAWQVGKSPFEQPGIQDHVAHYRQWQQQGKLLLGGPFMDGAAGGMMLPSAGLTEAEVRAFASADPAVQSGLLRFELRPWLIGMRQ